MTNLLNPLTLPLHGSRLIEASAGTGKTWTIAALYVRLVLGHGAESQAAARPMLPAEILVMTFTKAATRELSDRIRRRLVEAAAVFRGEAQAHADDTFLQALLTAYPEGPERRSGAWRLAMAAEAMDDAAVHTIDAWCQRMLREHAFDSGCLFDEELQANQKAMLAEASRDYWRQQIYPLSDEALSLALAQWPEVGSLLADAAALLEQDLPPGSGAGSLADCLEQLATERNNTLATLKHGWTERARDMQAWLDAQFARKDCPFNKVKIKQANYTRWLEALVEWAGDAAAIEPDLKTGRERLTATGLTEVFKPGQSVDLPPGFTAFGELMHALSGLPQPGPMLRVHAAARIAERLQELKSQAGAFGFHDMLERLDRALDDTDEAARDAGANDASPNGQSPARRASAQRLRERIVQQYPVALVDEFQDTSPLQLRIFNRLYRIGAGTTDHAQASGTALFLIGDPKQSIYGFRGADIYSYLGARRATQGRHYVLGVNHRSTEALVGAVNHLFERAHARPGEGAFLFRPLHAEGDAADPLPFVAVGAKGRAERFVTGTGDVAAMTLCLDGQLSDKKSNLRLYAQLCAERIVTLLNDPQAGFAGPEKPFRRLRPGDIAVLVRSGLEAQAVRAALRRRGLPSVYLSDKDSVLQSAEAQDLLRLLRAVSAPRDVRLARAALATGLFGFSVDELQWLADDDERFDAHCEQLAALQTVWQTQGVLAMIRRALHRFDLPARWLAPSSGQGSGKASAKTSGPTAGTGAETGEGERRLTNLLHLAELLQAASDQLDGDQALVRWLASQMEAQAAEGGADDTQVLRLESDADLVQIVTVHKSKGLEYPLVFLPFPAQFRAYDRHSGSAALTLPDGQGKLRLVLDPTDDDLAAADKERLREDVRLLYVALTRARHALWIGAAALKVGQGKDCVWHRSAIGTLISGVEPRTPEELTQDVQALAKHPEILVEDLRADPVTHLAGWPARTWLQRREGQAPLSMKPDYDGNFERNWAISSYSALVRATGRAEVMAGSTGDDMETVLPTAADGLSVTSSARVVRDDEPLDDSIGVSLGRAGSSLPVGLDAAGAGSPQDGAAELGAMRLAADPWHRFPRGAFAGNFLHGLLEWLAGEQFALDDSLTQEALAKRCEQQGWGHRSEDVLAWLQMVCATPLPVLAGASLRDLEGTMPEMEFWYPSQGLRTKEIDRLCRTHLMAGRERPELADRMLNGMLMGFADLVFEHSGRYWVLDYKSNALGLDDVAYSAGAMEEAVLAHRYDVQATLYQLALHRLLRVRLGAAYDPDRHLGGTVFLFLRGMRGPASGCCVVPAPPILIDGLDAVLPQPGLELA